MTLQEAVTLQRIAAALERLATAFEKQAFPDAEELADVKPEGPPKGEWREGVFIPEKGDTGK
jgi:hypothetical protein